LLVPDAAACARRGSRLCDPRCFLDSLAVYLKPAGEGAGDARAAQQLQAAVLLVAALLAELQRQVG